MERNLEAFFVVVVFVCCCCFLVPTVHQGELLLILEQLIKYQHLHYLCAKLVSFFVSMTLHV